jgi:PAS domain S-box-containing protein
MESQLASVLHIVERPAFLASSQAELLYMNEEMRKLVGARNMDRQRTLIGLGIFDNQAEFRGFMRGFSTVGLVQSVRLPSTRLREPTREVLLRAVFLKEEGLVFGTISISDTMSSPEVATASVPTQLLDQIPQLVLMTDGRGQVNYLNHAARRILAVPEYDAQALGVNIAKIDVEFSEVVWRENLLKARRDSCCSFQTHFFRRDGTLLPVEVEICEVIGVPVQSALIVATDISERRKQEQQLQATLLELDNLKYQRERDKEFLRDAFGNPVGFEAIISGSAAYEQVIRQIKLVAHTNSTVLITGETGTGKELVARAIHAGSQRASKPLVVVNCGALPRELIESELFGFRKGAFTGATRNQTGRFELADGGTLFLDEIGEMPLDLQTRLLRFLQEGEFSPIGSRDPVYVDVRIIAATNRNLEEMVNQGEFRSDLFFRLNVFPIHNPPLRERREDIPLLVDHFIKKHGRRMNAEVESAAPEMLAELKQYPFYGNIRELENIVERTLITSQGKLLRLDWNVQPRRQTMAKGAQVVTNSHFPDLTTANLSLDEMQKQYIEAVLEQTHGKVSGAGGAAEILGLNSQTLFSKIRKLKVKR